jgi:CheY-like chemotaxis protein
MKAPLHNMAKKIVILEDNAERRAAMQRCLQDRFYQFDAVFFQAAAPMLEYCTQHLDETILIDLDHDLELQPLPDGRCLDPGTGREVANFLAGKKAVCPVIIHTTNGPAGDAMAMVLQDAHWQTHRVVPTDDLEWIPTNWFRVVRRAIVGNTKPGR